MWFKLSGRWEKFRWFGEEMELQVSTPFPMIVRISEGARDEDDPDRVSNANIDSIAEVECSDEIKRQAPDNGDSCVFQYFSVEPVNVQRELRTVRYQMASATTRTANLIRWSVGPLGLADPFSDVTFSLSKDGQHWVVIDAIPLYRQVSNFVHANDEAWRQELQSAIDRGESEPIAHDIFRSAWDARLENPRAALVLGVAALEVGTKDCIARLVPETTWLVDNLPSPPVVDMLGKYLQELLDRRGNLTLFAPPKSLIKQVQEAVQHRNTIAHKLPGSERYEKLQEALDYLRLEETLWAIDDLLNLFDFYCGRERSFNHVSSKTRQLLIDRNNYRDLPSPGYALKHDATS
jgi:hypothetical protein